MLTVNQLRQVCANNKYIALIHKEGFAVGMNCKLASTAKMKSKLDKPTKFIAYHPISFQEYISKKSVFI